MFRALSVAASVVLAGVVFAQEQPPASPVAPEGPLPSAPGAEAPAPAASAGEGATAENAPPAAASEVQALEEVIREGAARDPMIVQEPALKIDVTEQVPPPPPAPGGAPTDEQLQQALARDAMVLRPGRERFDLRLGGYLRVNYGTFTRQRFFGIRMPASEDAGRAPNVGRNDGFGLGAARLNLRGEYGKDLYVKLGIEGAVVEPKDPDSPVGQLDTGVKDAYLRFRVMPELVVYAGRFKPPFDVEELTPTYDQMFVHRALESRGVLPHEGYAADMPGMAPGRQLGVMIGSTTAYEVAGAQLGYAAAVTNGNAHDASLNDNDTPAVWARATVAWGTSAAASDDEEGPATYGFSEGGLVGVGAFYNETAVGNVPTQLALTTKGVGVDAAVNVAFIYVQGQLLLVSSKPSDIPATPRQLAVGGHAQVAVKIPGTALYPGYRFAAYDPRVVKDEPSSNDRVLHHTLGLRYVAEEYPVVAVAEYTSSVEQSARVVSNNRFEAAVQVTFE